MLKALSVNFKIYDKSGMEKKQETTEKANLSYETSSVTASSTDEFSGFSDVSSEMECKRDNISSS